MTRPLKRGIATLLGLGLLGLAAYGFLVEPYRIEVRRVEIKEPYLARALGGLTVVQLSDLHIGSPGRREAEVLRLLDELKPDLLFLTGDYVEWGADYGAALDFLSRLHAKLGVYGVLGDYDYGRSRQTCLFCHQAGSGARARPGEVRFLKNEDAVISPKGVEVVIAGLDKSAEDGVFVPGRLSFQRPAIVLAHSPLLFDQLQASAPLLCLAGDTHGGQVRLPGALWRAIGYGKCYHYREGLFRRGQMMLYVSRGIGTSHLPLRLFEPPEVTVLRFVP